MKRKLCFDHVNVDEFLKASQQNYAIKINRKYGTRIIIQQKIYVYNNIFGLDAMRIDIWSIKFDRNARVD